jgi:hypothetical protein
MDEEIAAEIFGMLETDLTLGLSKPASHYRDLAAKLSSNRRKRDLDVNDDNGSSPTPPKKRRFFNSINNDPPPQNQTMTTDQLEIGKSYPIIKLRKVSSKYGDTIIAVLETTENENMDYFLPNRLRDLILHFGDYEEMETDHLCLKYSGKKGNLSDISVYYNN